MKCNGLLSVKKVFAAMILLLVFILSAPCVYADLVSIDNNISIGHVSDGVQFLVNVMVALLITFAIESMVVIVYMILNKTKNQICFEKRDRILLTLLLVNLVSLPVAWSLLSSFLPIGTLVNLLILVTSIEGFVVLFEGRIIYLFNKKAFTLKGVLFLSLIMNVFSFILGGFIYMILGTIF